MVVSVHNVVEDTHRFNVLPGLPNASALVNGCNFSTVPGVDIQYESRSHSFQEISGAMSTTVFDAEVILIEHRQFFDSFAKNTYTLFKDLSVKANNTGKMSSGQQDIKLWKLNNTMTSKYYVCRHRHT